MNAVRLTLALVAAALAAGTTAMAQQPTAPAAQDTLIGTVRSVDPRSGTIEMITGVGLVLRLYRVQVDEDVPVRIAGRSATLTQLERGQVVRIVYQTTTVGRVAAYVEVITWSDS